MCTCHCDGAGAGLSGENCEIRCVTHETKTRVLLIYYGHIHQRNTMCTSTDAEPHTASPLPLCLVGAGVATRVRTATIRIGSAEGTGVITEDIAAVRLIGGRVGVPIDLIYMYMYIKCCRMLTNRHGKKSVCNLQHTWL